MDIQNIIKPAQQLMKDSFRVIWSLFRIMIPTLIVIKIIEELGGVTYLSQILEPLMLAVGLPSELGLVWATSLLVNIFSGLLVLVNLNLELSVAQISTLGSMILIAHSLPVEAAIARQAGVSLWSTLLVRVGGSFLFGFLLFQIYQFTGASQEPAYSLLQQAAGVSDNSLSGWLMAQVKNLAMIYVTITMLLVVLRVLRLLGIERLMTMLLSPFLKLLGISREATSLPMVGVTLGLSYGGGLLIQEARNGHIQPRDIFCSIMLLNLLPSLIEDTMLILLAGADFTVIFWGRVVFSIVFVCLISFFIRLMVVEKYQRYFYKSVAGQ